MYTWKIVKRYLKSVVYISKWHMNTLSLRDVVYIMWRRKYTARCNKDCRTMLLYPTTLWMSCVAALNGVLTHQCLPQHTENRRVSFWHIIHTANSVVTCMLWLFSFYPTLIHYWLEMAYCLYAKMFPFSSNLSEMKVEQIEERMFYCNLVLYIYRERESNILQE